MVRGHTFRKVYGTEASSSTRHREGCEPDYTDPYTENGEDGDGGWDRPETGPQGELTA